MQSGKREINIFNMSLLDILCGALGAFCFMTLALLPSYKPSGPDAASIEELNRQLQQQLDDLKKKLAAMPDGESLSKQFDNMEQKIRQKDGELNRKTQELEEARQKIRKLELRDSVAFVIEWYTPHDVDIFLQSVNLGYANGKPAPKFDPQQKQGVNFSYEGKSDRTLGPGAEVWMIRDNPTGFELLVCYKLFAANGATGPATIDGHYLQNGNFYRLPRAQLSQEKSGVCVGKFRNNNDYTSTFTPAPEFAAAYRQQLERDKAARGGK
jgi:hypothetical protein